MIRITHYCTGCDFELVQETKDNFIIKKDVMHYCEQVGFLGLIPSYVKHIKEE